VLIIIGIPQKIMEDNLLSQTVVVKLAACKAKIPRLARRSVKPITDVI
jgi:hypothetical protein